MPGFCTIQTLWFHFSFLSSFFTRQHMRQSDWQKSCFFQLYCFLNIQLSRRTWLPRWWNRVQHGSKAVAPSVIPVSIRSIKLKNKRKSDKKKHRSLHTSTRCDDTANLHLPSHRMNVEQFHGHNAAIVHISKVAAVVGMETRFQRSTLKLWKMSHQSASTMMWSWV